MCTSNPWQQIKYIHNYNHNLKYRAPQSSYNAISFTQVIAIRIMVILVIKSGAVLRRLARDLGPAVRVRPDEVVPVIRVAINIIGTQRLGQVVELLVLPAAL
jgi:hypothetical protein